MLVAQFRILLLLGKGKSPFLQKRRERKQDNNSHRLYLTSYSRRVVADSVRTSSIIMERKNNGIVNSLNLYEQS